MKFQFALVMSGNESLESKIDKCVQENPTLHMDLIRSFGSSIMMALRLREEDNIKIESFKVGKIPDEPKKVEEDANKKVDN